ncbi:cytochrome P450 [Mycobacterium sp. 852002-40037_SCH5390672]|uniref:cytochrome P450 n=1 Tax=Mycobacterium sp. 852002-40037_SCH5390672 TaxID=1834089 RepID=UPI000805C162|nr:cytochrome P450 [Mycobacterium sp. 852002-40037_SCH5390672]OBB98546.1 cytochrome P450 [Mycobacterium sp. 852002-40037_SCH5390672]
MHSSHHNTQVNADASRLPLVPRNPLPLKEQARAARHNHYGQVTLREAAGGPVTRLVLGPSWLAPPIIFVMSPTGARDVLARQNEWCDRTLVHQELRRLMGDNLAGLPNALWRPRKRTLQPVFSRHHVSTFGAHMSEAAATIARDWGEEAEIDLDAEARRLTMRVLGRSVLGIDLDERAEALAEPLNTAVLYATDRGMRPIRAAWWLPTLARHRARAAVVTLRQVAGEVLAACRADPTRDAPLVHALIGATDPDTGHALSDLDICNDLIAFIFAGHDTTATTLAFALWALGRHPEIQHRVAEEVSAIEDRPLTPADVSRLGFTGQVISEALRLCPPVPVAGRTAMRDIDVDGYRVEAGTMLLVGTFGMHRDPAFWANPLEFNPDRFSPSNVSQIDRWQYIPFGAGPRSCIGDHFATLEITLTLATIIRAVEIDSQTDDFPLAVPFTVVAGAPIPARVRRRR